MIVRDLPILTDIYSTVDEFIPEKDSVYVSGTSVEERSVHSTEWEQAAAARGVEFVRINSQEISTIELDVRGTSIKVALRSTAQMRMLWDKFSNRAVYLDITGLSHHVWAPLVKAALRHVPEFRAVYREPHDYRFRANPIEGEIFDLSERILGV